MSLIACNIACQNMNTSAAVDSLASRQANALIAGIPTSTSWERLNLNSIVEHNICGWKFVASSYVNILSE